MTLSEIETILEELSLRHQDLNVELLATLLQSAGWEDKNIKEAVTLFKQRPARISNLPSNAPSQAPVSAPVIVAPQPVAQENKPVDLTFYESDGKEERDLPAFTIGPDIVREKEKPSIAEVIAESLPAVVIVPDPVQVTEVPLPKQEEPVVSEPAPVKNREHVLVSTLPSREAKDVEPLEGVRGSSDSVLSIEDMHVEKKDESIRSTVSSEPQSLIQHDAAPQRTVTKKAAEIPEDLPLLPYDNSPHVWPFSKYKEVFHGETSSPQQMEPQSVVVQQAPKPASLPVQQITEPVPVAEEEVVEIDLEKTPMTKGDESLVFLAGVMLFAIILILGYMYSNGRL